MGNRTSTAVDPGIAAPMMTRGQRDVVNCGGEAVESYIHYKTGTNLKKKSNLRKSFQVVIAQIFGQQRC